MANSATSAVYSHVIADVINKVRDEFINSGGPGEGVLNELQGIWEMKMIQAGVITGPIERHSAQKPTTGNAITPVHDLNVPYEGTEEYETPTAEMLFPPTPLQTPMQTPLPGSADSSMYNIPTGNSDYPTPVATPANDNGGNGEIKAGRPTSIVQPPSHWMNQRPPLGVDVNVAYVEGRDEVERGTSHQPPMQDFFMMSSGKRKRENFTPQYPGNGNVPQQDGAGDALDGISVIEVEGSESFGSVELHLPAFQKSQGGNSLGRCGAGDYVDKQIFSHLTKSCMKISQLDGPIPDPYDDMLSTPNIYNYQTVVNEDYNVVNTPAPNEVQPITPAVNAQNNVGEDDDDEPPLNENDDDDELDEIDEAEESNTQHLVLAQFDKVTRTKSKWKCTLKDGIMHINNREIIFNKATGEFDF